MYQKPGSDWLANEHLENSDKFLQLSGSAYNHELKPAYLSIDQIRRKISPRVEKLDPEQRLVFELMLGSDWLIEFPNWHQFENI